VEQHLEYSLTIELGPVGVKEGRQLDGVLMFLVELGMKFVIPGDMLCVSPLLAPHGLPHQASRYSKCAYAERRP
ncbi:hypothetical protein HAX54_033446, partial [Datura stramonium]|nr:hypothetical protein [Datura stramonium]